MKEILNKLVIGKDLLPKEAEYAMGKIMRGESSDAQIAAFLVALRMKGESVDEIAVYAKTLRGFSIKIKPKVKTPLVDTCGAGGDVSGTFNISTTAAFVAAGAGVPIAKHGNRMVSSKSGSADVLQELGVNIECTPKKVEECIEKAGIGFMFAPLYHTAMKHVIDVRKELGMRTVFNVLGPLISPADVRRQVYGIFDPDLTEKLAEVLKEMGSEHCLVVHGMDGLDEISNIGKTKVSELKSGRIQTYFIQPKDFGMKTARASDLTGGGPKENAAILTNILFGEKGPKRDIVVLNAAAAIYVGGKADDMKAAVALAEKSIDSGAAKNALDQLIKVSNS